MHFEDTGLFLSFISYPFFVDGRKLYNETLKDTFSKHRDKLYLYDPCGFHDQNLYKPEGYRMFGSHGLVILSLVDDYMFFHRYFNKNHLQSLLGERNLNNPHKFDFKSEIISGVTENDGESLEVKAKNSFLLEDKRFPFIGIIRMKTDQRLLKGEGNGIKTIQKIKKQIDSLSKQHQQYRKCHTKHITIDCFSNDELITIAFSDSLLFLFDFMGEIRSIKNTDQNIQQEYKETIKGKERSFEKHMFGTTFISFGYNVDLNDDDKKHTFLSAKNEDFKSLTINCLIETKPGHCDRFFGYLKKQEFLKNDSISRNVTGGCNIVASMTMEKIFELEEKCQHCKVFHRDVRKIKVSIKTPKKYVKSTFGKNEKHSPFTHIKDPIDTGYIGKTKCLMKKIGVSKMMRERLLALFELYNRAYHDLLQQLFLDELKPILLGYYTMMDDMYKRGDSIKSIEDSMNDEITNMESACYDRLHHNRRGTSLLEYSSGIQQHLTSFDYAYKAIYKAFCTDDPEPRVYITVTGAERAASERTLFKMNINDIVFPELFITAAWKEMANFAHELFLNYEGQLSETNYGTYIKRLLRDWGKFIKDEESINILKYNLSHSSFFHSSDKVYSTALSLFTSELLEYFFKDFLVFHFAFQRDLEKMWYFLLKALLQTTPFYSHLNEFQDKHLIHTLIRLFMVWLLSKPSNKENDSKNDRFITQQASVPFDNIIAKDWIECFMKVKKVVENLFDSLEAYDFKSANEALVFTKEQKIIGVSENSIESIAQNTGIFVACCLNKRKTIIEKMEQLFKNGELVVTNEELSDTDYIICLFQAYMNCIYCLDNHERIVKTLPRDENGLIRKILETKIGLEQSTICDNTISILTDVTGGFFVPSARARKEYFMLRTTLYRSLWNYRFTHAY